MRTLELIEEHEGIDQQALDDYAKLFAQPLPDSHLQALATLFHWSLPKILGEDGGGGLLSLATRCRFLVV
jgi:beta-glucosidase/6-phospho-beta-glucosidase/beta-galactosidase